MPRIRRPPEGDAVHRGTADHQPGRVGRAGGRGRPGHRHVDWRGRAVNAVAADSPRFRRRCRASRRPSSSTSSTSGLSGILSELLGAVFHRVDPTGLSRTFVVVRVLARRHPELDTLRRISRGFLACLSAADALGPLMATPMSNALTPARRSRREGPADGAAEGAAEGAAGAEAAGGALGSGLRGLGDLRRRFGGPGSSGLSRARCRCRRAGPGPRHLRRRCWVACRWRRVAGRQSGRTSGLPMAAGLPLMMGGLPRAAVAAAAGVGGAVASKYGPRLTVVARSPAAGYPPDPASVPTMAYPVPAGFPTNGTRPPDTRRPSCTCRPTDMRRHMTKDAIRFVWSQRP